MKVHEILERCDFTFDTQNSIIIYEGENIFTFSEEDLDTFGVFKFLNRDVECFDDDIVLDLTFRGHTLRIYLR